MPENSDHARLVHDTWAAALRAHDLDDLRRRLAWDGVPMEDAAAHLRSLARSEAPGSFPRIQAWLRGSTPIGASDAPAPGAPVPFADLWQRIASAAVDELARTVPPEVLPHGWPAGGSPVRKGVRADLQDDLVTRLSAVGEPALWAEFNRRRTPDQVVLAHLGAGTGGRLPRALYCAFLEELRRDGLESLTATYPVLRRHLATTLEQWLRSSREILVRVHRDRDLLEEALSVPAGDRLAGIRQNLSDPHRGGRTVAVLSFASGSPGSTVRRVVYKPKDLRMDQAFQRLLGQVPAPAGADEGRLRGVEVVACSGYGYMEWVRHEACTSEAELAAFYQNAGRLAAVLHLVGCSDCHHENLIAHRDQLVLVDAETLFEAIPAEHLQDPRTSTVGTGLDELIGTSVLRLGLLPQWHFVGRERVPRDVSALGVAPPPSRYERAAGWVDLNTDGMIAGRVERVARLPTSLPVGVGSPNRLPDFVEEFCDGFEGQLAAFCADKRRWLDPAGPLARFATCRRRFVPRPTWLYMWLQGRQMETDALASETAQRLLLENLARSYLVSAARPRSWSLFASEVAQMQDLDVPFFEHAVAGLDLVTPDGSTVADYFAVSGFDNARQRFADLDRASIDLQLRIVRGVVAAKSRQAHADLRRERSSPGPGEPRPSDGDRRREAAALGDLLVRTALTDGTGAVEWLGIDVAEDVERSRYGALGPSLYGGRSGIAVFLAALTRAGGVRADGYKRTATEAVWDLRVLLDRPDGPDVRRWWRDQPLGLAGSGGVLLALIQLRDLLPELAEPVARGLPALLESLDVDRLRSGRDLDLVHGCAGLIGPLLRIGTPRALRLAREAGDILVERQDACGGWVDGSVGPRALTGFSHGAAGMAAALARLHSVTGTGAYLEAAARALHYERETFDAAERNWPDFRGDPDPARPRFMLSWCHGAPGIALSRLCMAGTSLQDARFEEELHHALESTADPAPAGDSLCCGRFGRAAILRVAARQGSAPRWREAAARLEGLGLAASHGRGAYSFGDVPGLFQGAAGVGLALLDGIHEGGRLLPSLLPSLLSAGLSARGSTT